MSPNRSIFAVRVIAASAIVAAALAFQLTPGNVLRLSAQATYVAFPFPIPFPITAPPVFVPQPVVQVVPAPAPVCGNPVMPLYNTLQCPAVVVNQPLTTTTTTTQTTAPSNSCTPMTDGQGGYNYPPGCPPPTFPLDPTSLKNPQASANPANIADAGADPLRVILSQVS